MVRGSQLRPPDLCVSRIGPGSWRVPSSACGESSRWGKAKLIVLLRRAGYQTSESTVGRILTHLRRRGVLVDPPTRRRKRWRPLPRP